MGRGVRNQKEWDSGSGLWKKDISTKQNRQVRGKMQNSVVNMLLVLPARDGTGVEEGIVESLRLE